MSPAILPTDFHFFGHNPPQHNTPTTTTHQPNAFADTYCTRIASLLAHSLRLSVASLDQTLHCFRSQNNTITHHKHHVRNHRPTPRRRNIQRQSIHLRRPNRAPTPRPRRRRHRNLRTRPPPPPQRQRSRQGRVPNPSHDRPSGQRGLGSRSLSHRRV
jgi:hypothetical protein